MRKPSGAAAPLIWVQPPPPPRQRSLGREEIVAAAIALADEAGPGALTMKAVAARLGPYTAMALYRYVYNKDGLVDLMLDAATAEVPVPAQPGPDWRADLLELATQTRQMIMRHPWYATLIHTRPPVGPHMMRRLEFMLRVLTARGASTAAAMTYAALIDRHIFGSGLQEAEEARMTQRHGLVDDAGPGLPREDAARAFDRFHRGGDRADAAAGAGLNGSGGGGSGLGLSIVQAIAVAHGGRATLESWPGQGTRVRVWLPTVTHS